MTVTKIIVDIILTANIIFIVTSMIAGIIML
jgi:hypothetical protein